MTDRRPVDQSARDKVRTDHTHTLFVEAAAGTGKTQALVDRVVALVARGAPLRTIAAITFTEAAAAELRDRIRDALEIASAGDDPYVTSSVERERCATALAEIDDAALTTLHGFAQRLLGDHPLEAGLPPGFEVLDEVAAGVRFEQRWSEFVQQLLDDDTLSDLVLQGFALGLAPDVLREVARTLRDNYDRVTVVIPAPVALPPLSLPPLLDALDDSLALADHCTDPDDKLLVHLDELVGWRAELDRVDDDLDRLDLLAHGPTLKFSQGRKGNWAGQIDVVRGRLEDAEAALDALLGERRRLVIGALLDRVVAWTHAEAAERARVGELEFHDLLVRARAVLRDDPRVRAAAGERYRYLLLDEFQDTDPIQLELAALVVAEPGALDVGWRTAPIEGGRLFIVGDPKQSIYRFRRADLGLYLDARDALPHDDVVLHQSFRSVPAVIDLANALFRRLLEAAATGTQAAPVDLVAWRDPLDGDAPVVGFLGDAVDANLPQVRAVEADEIARLLHRIRDEAWTVADEIAGTRPARLDDIAILLPSRTALPALEDALERHDIPARIESQSLVFATAEVRDLLAILTAVDDPTDQIATIAAMRSPAFGCSDASLVAFRRAGGRFDYRFPAPTDLGDRHPVVAAGRRLLALHEQRWWQSVSETVAAVVADGRFLELACARRRPRDHWRRIRFFVEQARAWDDAGRSGLRGFIEWVQLQADERARAVEVVVPERDDDAARILTVHGAKGLEFPIVIVAGLNVDPVTRYPAVLFGSDGILEVRVGARDAKVATEGYEARLDAERRHEEAERVRLLYVAMTRARDRLFVSLYRKATQKRCDAVRIAALLDEVPLAAIDVGDAAPPAPPPTAPPPVVEPRAAWQRDRDALLARASRPATVAATALARADVAEVPGLSDGDADTPDERPPWQRGRAGTAVGRAVHAVLQTIDLDTGTGLDATARAQALAERVPDREDEIRALVRAVLAAPAIRAAVASQRYWREVPVGAPVDGAVVEGFIDLLYEGADGLVVVDYKTDRVDDEHLDALLATYRVQGATYAVALEAALGRPVAEVVFVFARTRGAIERAVSDLPAARAEVRARLAAIIPS
jgi:ATP-dependent exoDNAse (exonuclease V) beta subunit